MRPLGEAPLRGRFVELPLVTPQTAEAMRRRARHPAWARGFPRQDDLESLRTVAPRGSAQAPWGSRLVVRRGDGAFVGTVGFHGPPDECGRVELGYGLVEDARGAGLLSDALRLLVPAAEAAGAWVWVSTAAENVPSTRALERAGFERAGAWRDGGLVRYARPRPDGGCLAKTAASGEPGRHR